MFQLPYLLFDIGGTKTRLAASQNGSSFSSVKTYPTPPNFDEGINLLIKYSQEILSQLQPGAIAGGIAGPLNQEKSMAIKPPNLTGWHQKPVKQILAEKLACPIFLENDTALAGLGEANVGAGRGRAIVAYLTVSTGVNGVRIVNGQIDANAFGFEIGHQIIDFDHSSRVGTSQKGELEDFISGREIQKRHGQAPSEIVDPTIWADITEYLSVGVANTILYWSPEIIIFGGGLMPKISLDLLADFLPKYLSLLPTLPQLKKAELGDHGVLHGALQFLNQLHLDAQSTQQV